MMIALDNGHPLWAAEPMALGAPRVAPVEGPARNACASIHPFVVKNHERLRGAEAPRLCALLAPCAGRTPYAAERHPPLSAAGHRECRASSDQAPGAMAATPWR